MREGFVFYRSWMEALDCLPPEQYKEAMQAILKYGLNGEETSAGGITQAMMIMAKPTIDMNNRRAENGKKGAASGKLGGRPSTEAKPQDNPKVTPKEPQDNPKVTPSKRVQITDNRITDTDNNKNTIVPPETGRRGEPIPYQAVIDHLNKVCGTKYAATTAKTRECIRARCREGATLEDFITVIDRKAKEWLGTDRAMYLRPETLFGTKFDGYLNAPRAAPKKAAKQFNDFHQRDQDYDAISKALIEKQLAALGATSVVDVAQGNGEG